ncbi:MAG: DUF3822 family protein [Bacteroidales bacterium]|nr:DUF3822 family protein [Bacteroidales bacterium]
MHKLLQASAQYIDSGYQSEDQKEYRLSIQLRLDGFSFAIINPSSRQLLKLEEFKLTIKPGISVDESWNILHEYFLTFLNQNQLDINSFQKTIITIDHQEYSMVPQVLFLKDKIEEQIGFSQSIYYPYSLFNNPIPGTDRQLISAIYKPLYHTIQDHFNEVSILHTNTVLQNEVNKHHKNKKIEKRLYISVSDHIMHLLGMENENLLLNNSFSFTSKEDFVYFILLAFDQLSMNQEVDNIYFLGDISRTSPIYQICWQYIRNINFIENTWGINAGSAFDNMPIHQYFTLIHSSLCE